MSIVIYIVLGLILGLGTVDRVKAQRNASATMEVRVKIVNSARISQAESVTLQADKDKKGTRVLKNRSEQASGFNIKGIPRTSVYLDLPESIALINDQGEKINISVTKPMVKSASSNGKVMRQNNGQAHLDEKSGKLQIQMDKDMKFEQIDNKAKSANSISSSNVYKGTYKARIEYL